MATMQRFSSAFCLLAVIHHWIYAHAICYGDQPQNVPARVSKSTII